MCISLFSLLCVCRHVCYISFCAISCLWASNRSCALCESLFWLAVRTLSDVSCSSSSSSSSSCYYSWTILTTFGIDMMYKEKNFDWKLNLLFLACFLLFLSRSFVQNVPFSLLVCLVEIIFSLSLIVHWSVNCWFVFLFSYGLTFLIFEFCPLALSLSLFVCFILICRTCFLSIFSLILLATYTLRKSAHV